MKWKIPKNSVLVPYDFSDAARDALQVAATFVEESNAVSVLHVVVPPPITAPGRLVRGPFDEEEAIGHGFKALTQALDDEGHPSMEAHVRVGHPAETIVDYALAMRAELIVIPSNQRKGLDRFLLGSVTERVVRLSPCPVLVLRAPNPELSRS